MRLFFIYCEYLNLFKTDLLSIYKTNPNLTNISPKYLPE